MRITSVRNVWSLRVAVAVAFVAAGSLSSVYAQGLDPASVTQALKPGDSFDLTKTVITPPIPPRPDICYLADTTGSMGATLTNVRNNATMIMNLVRAAQPDSQFCAAQYKDAGSSRFPGRQAVTPTIACAGRHQHLDRNRRRRPSGRPAPRLDAAQCSGELRAARRGSSCGSATPQVRSGHRR